ncbi:unnamed protein product [Closterium sp. NIES-54]
MLPPPVRLARKPHSHPCCGIEARGDPRVEMQQLKALHRTWGPVPTPILVPSPFKGALIKVQLFLPFDFSSSSSHHGSLALSPAARRRLRRPRHASRHRRYRSARRRGAHLAARFRRPLQGNPMVKIQGFRAPFPPVFRSPGISSRPLFDHSQECSSIANPRFVYFLPATLCSLPCQCCRRMLFPAARSRDGPTMMGKIGADIEKTGKVGRVIGKVMQNKYFNAVVNTVASKPLMAGLNMAAEHYDDIKREGEKAGRAVGKELNKAGNNIKNGVNRAGNHIKNGVNRAGSLIKNGVNKAGNAVKNEVNKAGNAVKNEVNKAGNAVKNEVNKAGRAVERAGKAVGNAAKKAWGGFAGLFRRS